MLKKDLDTLESAKEKIKTARELVESLYEYEPHDNSRKYEDKDISCDIIYEEAIDHAVLSLDDLIGAIKLVIETKCE